MIDIPMFDVSPGPRFCARCGRDVAVDSTLDVCAYCLAPCSSTAHGCSWCETTSTGAAAVRNAARAAADADPEFAHAVQKALAVVRNRREPFTAAEVRAELHNAGVVITRPAAIGSAFRSAAAAGVIRANGDFVPSPVKGQHDRPLRVWVAA